jgi:hypothetical protein
VLRLLNKTIELSAASARNAKDNGVCMLLGLLVRGEGRRLTSAILTQIFSSFSFLPVITTSWGPSRGKQLPGERPRETAET